MNDRTGRQDGVAAVPRRGARRAGAAWLFAALAPLVAGAGSEGAPRFGEIIDVPLVEVELLAVDRAGRPVDDLKIDELVVFEDGVRIAPATFERIASAASARGGPRDVTSPGVGGASTGADRYVAIFLDEVHVGPAGRRRLLADLATALDERLEPGDRVMVALYDGATHLVLPFTRDRKALRRTLEDAGALSTARLLVDQERRTALEMIYRDASGESGTSPCLHMQEIVDAYQQQENHRVDLAIRGFRRFVDSLAGIEGRKSVFHVSDGIPLRPGSEASEYAQELCSDVGRSQGQAGAAGRPGGRDIYDPDNRTLEALRYDTTNLWREVAARANAGNVTVYAFQAELGPNRFPASAEQRVSGQLPGAQARAIADLQEPLFLVSEGTGGRALLGGGDLSGEIAAVVDELRGQYLLTYSPPARPDNDLRQIRIEVTRPGVEVRHRKLYRPQSLDDQIGNQLMGRLLYGDANMAPANGAQLELGAVQRLGDELVSARFRLGVPLAALALTDGDGVRQGSFTAYVSIAATEGGTSAVRKALVPVTLHPDAKAEADRFVWEVEIVLRPGKLRLGVAVHDEVAGTTSFVVRGFDVPRG